MSDYIELWNDASRAYDAYQKAEPSMLFLQEHIRRSFPHMEGKRILDLACGSGNYTDLFCSCGAEVFGCDGAENMIALARKKHPECNFSVCDICEVLPYPDHFFDLIFSNMALMDVENFSAAITEGARVLTVGGSLHFSIVHPLLYTGEWVCAESGQKTAYTLRSYLSEHTVVNHYWGPTAHFHRPLSFYINESLCAGLTLTGLEEVCIEADGTRPAQIPTLTLFTFKKLEHTE